MEINVNDILKLKKPHPCGSTEWRVIRTGADIKLKCLGCDHMVMLPRQTVEKSVKSVRSC